jgi:hypothetical protein
MVETLVQARAAAASLEARLPIVGYASGAELQAAIQAGFATVGDLRIKVADRARF